MQNFGKIKNIFNNIMIEGIVNRSVEGKNLFKKYLRTIKESKILRTQFLVYSNIENRVDSDLISVNNYIAENVKLLDVFKKADIIKENEKLLKLISVDEKVLNEDYDLAPLHESVTKLIFTKKNAQNLDILSEETKKVSTYITTNKVAEPAQVSPIVDFPQSTLMNLMVTKFNEKYNSLDEDVKDLMKVLINGDLKAKQTVYEELVDECNNLVTEHLKTADDEFKAKLLKVRTKLETVTDLKEEGSLSKVFKLLELRNDLKK